MVNNYRYDPLFYVRKANKVDSFLSLLFGGAYNHNGQDYFVTFFFNGRCYGVQPDSAESALMKTVIQLFIKNEQNEDLLIELGLGLKVQGVLKKTGYGYLIEDMRHLKIK